MSQNHAQVDASANMVRAQGPNDITMSQVRLTPVTPASSATLTAAAVLSGAVYRTGPTAGYADVFPSAADICAACPVLNAGDSFEFFFINSVAFANTVAAGTGIVLGVNTAIAASNTRTYLLTALAVGVNSIAAISTTNASAVLSGFSDASLKLVSVGMGVTGIGIPASTTVIAVNATNNTVTMSANATATGSLVAATFTPRIQIDGVMSSAL